MRPLRILFSGMVAGDPFQGGASWAVLPYVLGLRALGHEVHLVEPVERFEPGPERYFDELVRDFGLEHHAALLAQGAEETRGLGYDELARAAERADLLINVSGMLRDETLAGPPPLRVFLDLDPAFNQLWHVAEGIDMGLDAHNRFATVGLELGGPDCPIPTDGRTWVKTLPPVFLPLWERGDEVRTEAMTTVANWRGYGSIEWEGTLYGQKAHSYRRLVELPRIAPGRLMPALEIDPGEREDLSALRSHGWELADPREVAGSPQSYADFVRGSKGELGVAKSGYVESRCGWFSDRSACCLASGRPVVAQETGFSRHLPVGEGLLAFSTAQEAAEAIAMVRADYPRHSRAARSLAEERLDSDVVLSRLLKAVGALDG